MNKILNKRKLVKDISANSIQTLVTQIFGLVIFYITSKYLPKDDFGEFNWSMALGFTIIAVASLGLDLVFIKRVASGQDVLTISGIHFFHTLFVGFVLCSIAFIIYLTVPSFTHLHPLFFFIFLNIAVINIANSFKLCMNGLEAFKNLAILSLCINIFKFLMVLFLYVFHHFHIMNIVGAYLATSCLEFFMGYYLMNKSINHRVKPLLRIKEYKYFILESLPQLGVVVFDSALSRMDLILLGLLSTQVVTAEYSFVYKVYELSKLPMLIVAPVLLTRFSKIFGNNKLISEPHKNEIQVLLKLELFLMLLIPIFLICTWTPLVDYFTNNKYGAVNEINYRILAGCAPLICLVNFMWTLGFVQGQLKTIMIITIVVSVSNVLANLFLIPFYGSLGSSIAFLVCTVLQVFLYLKFIKQDQVRVKLKSGLVLVISAGVAIIVAKQLTNNIIFTTIISFAIYIGLSFLSKQLSVPQIKQVINKK